MLVRWGRFELVDGCCCSPLRTRWRRGRAGPTLQTLRSFGSDSFSARSSSLSARAVRTPPPAPRSCEPASCPPAASSAPWSAPPACPPLLGDLDVARQDQNFSSAPRSPAFPTPPFQSRLSFSRDPWNEKSSSTDSKTTTLTLDRFLFSNSSSSFRSFCLSNSFSRRWSSAQEMNKHSLSHTAGMHTASHCRSSSV